MGWVRKVLALIKSLIYGREEEGALEACLNKIDQSRSKLSADTFMLGMPQYFRPNET